MAIARHPVLSNTSHGSYLPLSFRTLYELSRLPVPELEAAIATGYVRPDMERAEAISLVDRTRDMDSHLYFLADHAQDRVRIGWSDNGGIVNRLKSHEREVGDAYELLAVVRGNYDDEQALHRHFRDVLIGGSWYAPDEELCDYVSSLLARNFATNRLDHIASLPGIPSQALLPNESHDHHYVAPNGQASLLAEIPPLKRPAFTSTLAHLSSESDEWLTPSEYIEAARRTMGEITTDPATCPEANTNTVHAEVWYTKNQNGLSLPWRGCVWLNPPYGRGESSAAAFIAKLLEWLDRGGVQQAVTCLNLNSASALWFNSVWRTAECHVVHMGRIDFRPPSTVRQDGPTTPTKGTIFSYWGDRVDAFKQEFSRYGHVVTVDSEWLPA